MGVVRAINVRDGQSVKAGEVLIERDPTVAEAELHHLESDLIAARVEAARLRAALAGHEDPMPDFHPPKEASPEASPRLPTWPPNGTAKASLGFLTLSRLMRESGKKGLAIIGAVVHQPILRLAVGIDEPLRSHLGSERR
jgi:hemolysin D